MTKPVATFDTVERRAVELNGTRVEFVVRRSPRRRGIGLRIDHDGLVVLVPQRCSQARIDAAVSDQERWVLEKLATWTARRVPPPMWRDGERLPFRGGHAVLRFDAEPVQRQLEFDFEPMPRIELAATRESIEDGVVAWYRAQALPHLTQRVAHFARCLGEEAPRVLLSEARTRWGSCSHDRVIRLSWRLIKAGDAEIDYVVAHEVSHLRHMNHGRQFWSTVADIYPQYRAASRELDRNDLRYRTF
jgi:predicted metal-dependent hydrolase